jgi:hypothetical protein
MTEPQKLMIGYFLGGAFFIACLVIATRSPSSPWMEVVLCLFGGAAGWTTGILATPLDRDEKTRFSSLAKAFLAAGSGYAIAKLEQPIVDAFSNMLSNNGAVLAMRVSLFATCFLVGLLFTLVSRLYGEDSAERKRRKHARLLDQADQLLEQLQKARE